MSSHFDDKAAFLAALPEEDAERQAALTHARSCQRCAQAWAEGARTLAALDAALESSGGAIEAERLERMLARTERGIAADERRQTVWPAFAVVAAWLLEVALARELAIDSRSAVWSVLVLGAAVALAVSSRFGLRAAMGAVAVSALFALGMGSGGSFAAAIGVKCTLLELLAAVLPWGAYAWSSGEDASRGQGAAVAAAGALAGHAVLHLSCPVRHAEPHLLLFHLGGVVLAAWMGGLATPLARKVRRAG